MLLIQLPSYWRRSLQRDQRQMGPRLALDCPVLSCPFVECPAVTSSVQTVGPKDLLPLHFVTRAFSQ